jgi:hypothetical protein
MKFNHSNNKRYRTLIALLLATAVLTGSLSGCKKTDFILPDHNAMDERLWQEEGAIQLFLNGTYSVIMPDYPFETQNFSSSNIPWYFWGSDENVLAATGDAILKKVYGLGQTLLANDIKLIGNKYQGSQKWDNRYFDIARCNLALTKIPDAPIPALSKKSLMGQFYALRAMGYFDLIRAYGGVPLLLKPADPDNLDIGGRVNAAGCFKQMIADLDSAMVQLDGVPYTDAADRGKWTKFAAAAYKAKILLYWASPQFNPVNDPLHPHDPTRWDIALKANKEAYDLCVAAGKSLSIAYPSIFLIEGTANPEAIIVRSYSKTWEKRYNNVESKSRPPGATTGGGGYDGYVPTNQMLNAYTMNDGTPITGNPAYDAVFYWKNRDPRFDATIAYNGSTWKLNGKLGTKQWTYKNEIEGSNKPFYCKRFSDITLAPGSVGIANDKGGNGLDWIELRFAEVLMNYAECLNETGDLTAAKNLVRQIRVRAGILPGAAGNDYGLAAAITKEQMRDLMLNERMVEFAFEGKRAHDLRRTRRLHLLSGQFISAPVVELNEPSGVRVKKDHLEGIDPNTGLRRRDTLDMNNKTTYLFYFKPQASIIGNVTNAISISETIYFYGIHSGFLQSSPLIDQTLGWEYGTFDPLK